MSVFSEKFKKTFKRATAWSLSALTALTCASTLPVLTSTPVSAAGSVLSDSQRGVIYASSRDDFRDESIYFLITTRFYDGDSSNNFRCVSDAEARNPESDPSWRGDFKGLIDKLDYIKALGFTAIWITPVVQNNSNYDYHGYHASNFNAVDYRYESNGVTYQTLIDAVHAKGMKVIQDVVFNHTCRNGEEGLNKLGGEVMANQLSLPWPQMNEVIMSNGAQYDPNNIYHHNTFAGSGDYDNYNAQIMTIADDCFDLETENPVVTNYLVDAYKKYIDMGVDAFRVDTARHISRITMNAGILPHLQAEAERIGNDDFYMFGEVCTRGHDVWYRGVPAISTCFYTWDDSDSEKAKWSNTDLATNEALAEACYNNNTSADNQPTSNNAFLNGNDYHQPDYSKRSDMGVIDFQMHWSFENANNAFGTALGEDKYFNDSTWNVVYVNSHDYSPDFCSDKVYTGDTDSWAENLSLMFSFRGIPCVYYGTEIEFQKGCPIDKGPKAMLSETGRAYYGDNIEGTIETSDFTVFNASGTVADTLQQPLSQHLMCLNRIRQAVPALRKGQYSTEGCSGGISFKRRYTDANTDSFALVTISGSATFSGIPNGTYVDAVTGDTQTVSGGTLTANCSGKGNMRVYVLNTDKTPAPGRVIENSYFLTDGGSASPIKPGPVVVVPTTGLSVDPSSVTILEGESATVTATVSPSNATDKTVTWSTSDAAVATVSGGVIRGVAPGTATITAANGTSFKETVSVTVKENTSIIRPTGVTVSPSTLKLESGSTGTLTATVSPSDATDKSVTWSSSKESVATVSNGTVKAVSAGTATITATTSNGKTATATVTVEGPKMTYIDHGVYFKKPSSWGSNINVYIYDGGSDTTIGAAWPGSAMKKIGDDLYSYEFTSSASLTKVIFNDGNNQVPGSQMPGFDFTDKGYYEESGFVKVIEPEQDVEVTGVTVDPTSASVEINGTVALTASVTPSNATDTTITWSTSDASIATVSNGVVTGKSDGTATITASSSNGKSASAKITVTSSDDPPTALTVSGSLSATSVKTNTAVTIKVSAAGGTSPYQYAASYKQGSGSFTSISGYTSSDTFTFTPGSAGSYTIRIAAKDSVGSTSSKDIALTVIDNPVPVKLTNKSSLSAEKVTVNNPVTVNCAAAGGTSPYTFAVAYKKSSASSYTSLQNYSSNKSVQFVPTDVSDYNIRVSVKDSAGNTSSLVLNLGVSGSTVLTNLSTVSATKIKLGESFTVTGKASGGKTPYNFSLSFKKKGASGYSQAVAFSSNATMTFKPQSATTYSLCAKVRDNQGTTVEKYFTVYVEGSTLVNNSKLSATSLTLGNSLTMTGAATGGTSPYKYALFFRKYGTSAFTKYKDFSTTKTITFKPLTATTYVLRTKVKDSKGAVAYKDFTVKVTKKLTNTSKLSATSLTLGNSLTMTGSATGGTSPYKYALFFRKYGTSTFTKYKDFSTTKTITFKPLTATTYVLRTKVKDAKGTVAYKDFTVKVTKKLANTSKLSATTLTLGNSLTMTGSATGGTSPYKYALSFRKYGTSTFTKYKDYSTTKTITFKPLTATTYVLRTKVKDAKGAVATKDFTVKVVKKLTNTSKVSATSLTLGDSLTVTGSATGGVTPYKYALYFRKYGTSTFTKYRDYSTTKTITFKPLTATTYILRTKVKDGRGVVANKDITVKVTKPLTNTSKLSATSLKLGSSLTMTGSATGGTSPYKYALFFRKYGQSDFTKYKDYTTTNKITFKPQSATTYILRTKVKDAKGRVAYKDFTVKVTKS